MESNVLELISQLSKELASNPDSINPDIINKLNKMRKENPNRGDMLQQIFRKYNKDVLNKEVLNLISQLSKELASNPDNINPYIINELNKMRTNNPKLVEGLKPIFYGYNIHVPAINNKLHMSRYKPANFPLPEGGSRHKKHTRRHKKQKRTRRHRKH